MRFLQFKPVEAQPRHDQGGEHAHHVADGQRHANPLTGLGPTEEEERRDQRGEVGVEDRQEGLRNRPQWTPAWRLAQAEFLPDPLVDEHVGVHRHADGEHDAGDAGQASVALKATLATPSRSRACSWPRYIGNDSGEPIVNDHEEKNQDPAMMLAQVPYRSILAEWKDRPSAPSMITGAAAHRRAGTMARSDASSIVKEPVIWAWPPEILSWITGAEWMSAVQDDRQPFLDVFPE